MITKKENEYEAKRLIGTKYLTEEDELRPKCSQKELTKKENEYEAKREEGVAADWIGQPSGRWEDKTLFALKYKYKYKYKYKFKYKYKYKCKCKDKYKNKDICKYK